MNKTDLIEVVAKEAVKVEEPKVKEELAVKETVKLEEMQVKEERKSACNIWTR